MTHPIAYAIAHEESFARDSDYGSVIKNVNDGTFFCGYEMEDGSVGFKTIRQYEGGTNDKADFTDPVWNDKPVFLSPEEMETKGLNAIVFPSTNDAMNYSALPDDAARDCALATAEKNVEISGMAPRSQYATIRTPNNRTYGLADADSARAAQDDILPFDIGAALHRRLTASIQGLRNLVGLGGPKAEM